MFGWSSSDGMGGGGRSSFNANGQYTGDSPAGLQGGGRPALAAGDPFSALIGGLIGYAGVHATNQANKDIARQATDANMTEAQRNRVFQAMMSNTAFQRQMQDMKDAGLNPLLASGMNGASTPAGATGNAEKAHLENPLGAALSSGLQAYQMSLAVQKQEAEVGLMKEQGALNRANALNASAQTNLAVEQMSEARTKSKFYNEVGKVIDGYKNTNATGNLMKWYKHFTNPEDPMTKPWRPPQPVTPGEINFQMK